MVEWNRNDSRIYSINREKIVSKDHKKPIFFRRELFFYDLFEGISLIKTPEIYKAEGINIKTHFIETEKKNILKVAEEWAKVHSYFIKNPIKDSRFLIYHDIDEVSNYVSENSSILGELSNIARNNLENYDITKNVETILHGDLQKKNMVTCQGENYYFDFELGGRGHPARDIASMIISSPREKNEIIKTYRQNIDFDYSGFREDIDAWLLARAAQLYIIFDKRKGTREQKKSIERKLSIVIKNFNQ